MFRSYHEPLTFYSNKKELNHNIVFYLARKVNQKGFHERFKAIKKIGKGNFASVFEVKRIEDEKRFAVKAFSKVNTYSMPEGRDNLINELSVLRKIDHHNIVYLEGVYESENSIYVVLELIEGPQLYEKIAKVQVKINLEKRRMESWSDKVHHEVPTEGIKAPPWSENRPSWYKAREHYLEEW